MNLFVPSAIARWRQVRDLFRSGLAADSPDFNVEVFPATGQVRLTLKVAPVAAATAVTAVTPPSCACPDDAPSSLLIDGSGYHGFNFSICTVDACSWCGYDQAEPEDDRTKVGVSLGTEGIGPPWGDCYWIINVNEGILIGYKSYDDGNPIGDYYSFDGLAVLATVLGAGDDICVPC